MRAPSSLLVLLFTVSVADAQTLGDVARQESQRRQTVKTAGKVYTNDQLKPAPPSTATTPSTTTGAAAVPDSGTKPEPGTAGKAEAGKNDGSAGAAASTAPAPNDEKAWRAKAQASRDALSRAQIFAEALQSRVNGLSADFTARDDPAQRAAVAAERQKSLDELDRVKKDIQQHTKALSELQDEARKAGVPAGWLR